MRGDGKTTRLVDKAIQELFSKGTLLRKKESSEYTKGHENYFIVEDGSKRETTSLWERISQRLIVEHRAGHSTLFIKFDKDEIRIDPKYVKYRIKVGRIFHLFRSNNRSFSNWCSSNPSDLDDLMSILESEL